MRGRWRTRTRGTNHEEQQDNEDDEHDENVVYDEALYKEMKYRSIGPTRGGRSTTVTGVANAHTPSSRRPSTRIESEGMRVAMACLRPSVGA